VNDRECVAFLQWALPRLGMRWAGFRKVRRQVCRRIRRRVRELGLADAGAYRAYLEGEPQEWRRDRGVFEGLEREVFPALARADGGAGVLACLSVGCASGEEPYSLVLSWMLGFARRRAAPAIAVTALDSHPVMLARARRACYSPGTLKELPAAWRGEAFDARGGELCLRERFRDKVELVSGDVRDGVPGGPYRLVLCRNLVFTYFEESLQRKILGDLHTHMHEGAALVVGAHEQLPEPSAGFVPWSGARSVYRRV